MEVLKEILRGAADKAHEAGIAILGGHTIDDPEPKYGMTVSGVVHPAKIWANAGAQAGDAIILTKPVGTGILATAMKRGLLNETTSREVIASMAQLNKTAAEIFEKYKVHACTDVTGFGLTGHLSEVTVASGIDAEVFADSVPVFEGVADLAAANVVPGGTINNMNHFSRYVKWDDSISATMRIILSDAQTSGGLLCTVPASEKEKIISELKAAGIHSATHIGNCLDKGNGLIFVKNQAKA